MASILVMGEEKEGNLVFSSSSGEWHLFELSGRRWSTFLPCFLPGRTEQKAIYPMAFISEKRGVEGLILAS